MQAPQFGRGKIGPVRLGSPGLYGGGLVLLLLGYSAVLEITLDLPPFRSGLNALANVAPVAILGLGVRAILRRYVIGRPILVEAAAHLAIGLAFSVLWFWLLMVLLGAVAGENAVQFKVRPFPGAAATWQLFQGLTLYAVIVLAVRLEVLAGAREGIEANMAPAESAEQRPRLFIKQEDEIRPLDLDRIIFIRGADDYSEITTASGTHLVRMTLASLSDRLGEQFIRVHRSCLVNVDRIAKAESAGGGRMLLHMQTGEMIQSSRAGARLLRDRII